MKSENGIYGYYDTHKKEIIYIGQSSNIFRRHQQHLSPHRHNDQPINQILQHNPFRYKLMHIKTRDSFTLDDRNILEKHYIKFYNTYNDKYKFNYTTGGAGRMGHPLIDKIGGVEYIKKMSKKYNTREIADYIGVSKQSLRSYLRKHNTSILILRYS